MSKIAASIVIFAAFVFGVVHCYFMQRPEMLQQKQRIKDLGDAVDFWHRRAVVSDSVLFQRTGEDGWVFYHNTR